MGARRGKEKSEQPKALDQQSPQKLSRIQRAVLLLCFEFSVGELIARGDRVLDRRWRASQCVVRFRVGVIHHGIDPT